ncbi:ABC transporter transmembrane domain-containing protein, partial [Thermodesulfobacteriota bacterium]
MSENQFKEEVFTSQINIDTVIRIAKQGLTHWHLMLGILISVAFIAVLEAFHTYLSKQMIDLGIIPRDITALKYYAGIYAATLLVFAVFVFSLIYCAGILGHKVEYTLRKRLFDHLQNLSLSYFDKTPSGWIISRLTSDLNWVGGVISWGFLDLYSKTWKSGLE